jgi:hypothetical protein
MVGQRSFLEGWSDQSMAVDSETTTITPERSNPYVGPRAFHTGESLYGRDRELRDLLNYLLSQRIILLYSPSGAGKTSLIHAWLIPSLLERVCVFPGHPGQPRAAVGSLQRQRQMTNPPNRHCQRPPSLEEGAR